MSCSYSEDNRWRHLLLLMCQSEPNWLTKQRLLFRWLANLNIKRNLTSMFINKDLPSTHLLFINSFSSWSEWRKQSVVDCRRKVTKWTGLIVLANHNRSRESNEPITILRAIAGSQLKARENNCKQFSFWLAKNIAISKNVVGENDECQLSNGDCTTERKCGYWILIGNKLPWYRLHTVPTFDGESYGLSLLSRDQLAVRKAVSIGIFTKHDVDGSENVIWKCHFAFLQSSFNYSKSLCLKNAL